MQYLRADTNTEVLIGPAVAVGDGFTPVTTLSLSTADEAEIIKYGGATPLTVTSISANGFSAITGADGYYTLDITTGNSDTEGFLTVLINDDSLILPIRVDFMVVNANVYDSLFAAATTDYLQTDAIQFAGTAYATALAAEVDAVWDEPIAGHLTAGTAGLSEALGSAALVDSTITGTPTTTTFDFTGGSTSNNFYNDQLVYILSGTGVGQVRAILTSSYSGGTTTITVDEAWITTPAASDRFAILVSHVHPLTQITADIDANSTQLAAIVTDTNELQTDWTNGGRLDLIIDELTTQGDTNESKIDIIDTNVDAVLADTSVAPTAAQWAYIIANAATGYPVTFTTAGGSTTAAVLNQVDGAAASSTNDQYNGRLLVFTDGTLKGVVTDITDYVGSTTTATITAIPTAPTSSHNARLI